MQPSIDTTHTSTVVNLSPDQAGPNNLLSPLSTKLRSGCSRCASTRSLLKQMSISKRVIKQRLQILLHRNEQNRKLKQSLFRKVRIERKLRSELQDLKKDRIKKDALIQGSPGYATVDTLTCMRLVRHRTQIPKKGVPDKPDDTPKEQFVIMHVKVISGLLGRQTLETR